LIIENTVAVNLNLPWRQFSSELFETVELRQSLVRRCSRGAILYRLLLVVNIVMCYCIDIFYGKKVAQRHIMMPISINKRSYRIAPQDSCNICWFLNDTYTINFCLLLYKLILGLFWPTLTFIYKNMNTNSIFKIISLAVYIFFPHLSANYRIPDRKNDGDFELINSSRLFSISSINLNRESVRWCCILEIGDNPKELSLENMPHEGEFPSKKIGDGFQSVFCYMGQALSYNISVYIILYRK